MYFLSNIMELFICVSRCIGQNGLRQMDIKDDILYLS